LRSLAGTCVVLAFCLILAGCGEERLDLPSSTRDDPQPAPTRKSTPPPRPSGFGKLAATLDGEVGMTLGPPGVGEIAAFGELKRGLFAWSTIKVPIALAVLQKVGGPDGLTEAQRSDLERALTESDNEAAARLFEALGDSERATAAVTKVLRAAGDASTQVSTVGRDGFSPYGQTDWPLKAQHRFMAALAGGCFGDAPARDYVLDLMGRVTSDEWGLGSAGLPARWKGGWGPETGTDGPYLARQMGVLEYGDAQLVVTLAALPSDGRFESAQAMASQIARWIADRGRPLAGRRAEC
jgi:hypothetical protein